MEDGINEEGRQKNDRMKKCNKGSKVLVCYRKKVGREEGGTKAEKNRRLPLVY